MLGKYICIEGIDGVGKTTQVQLLNERIANSITTSEPGNSKCPITMELRKLVLDAQYDTHLTPLARDYLFQACRSINLEHIVSPAIKKGQHVISDRGAMSGFAYSLATDLPLVDLKHLLYLTTKSFSAGAHLYDIIVVLESDIEESLDKASEKKEFSSGDAIEMRGPKYMEKVRYYMRFLKDYRLFSCPIVYIDVKGKSKEQVTDEILQILVENKIL